MIFLACQRPIRQLQKISIQEGPVYRILEPAHVSSGDPAAGFSYLTKGDYLGSGVPFTFMEPDLKDSSNLLNRQGPNARLDHSMTAFLHANGTMVVNGNCFACHASVFGDSIYFGLGNSFSDFTERLPAEALNFIIKKNYGKDSPEWEAFYEFGTYYKAIAPRIKTAQIGANPAFRLSEACSQIRDPKTLELRDSIYFPMSSFNIATDVPALWHLRKKAAIYHNGMGRGAFSKLLMQASELGIHDTIAAREVQRNFVDVIAWIQSLEAPSYPYELDQSLAAEGKMLFENHCKKCHGTYGERETYPNKIVPLAEIKTDPLYAQYVMYQSQLPNWYNQSWFATSPPYSELKPSAGYMAPPLDGVWATAPYLHNGSVPTLADLLHSKQRPLVWERSGRGQDYDWKKVGWQYNIPSKTKGKFVFNTAVPGYGNEGHLFGDSLSESERKAVLEYLKTL